MTPAFRESIPLALYVHLPWCLRKCPYCDFNSHARDPSQIPEKAYVAALLEDLETDLPLVWGRRIASVFIGGGTPSLFSAEAIDALLSGIRARLPLLDSVEITLEANPGTVDESRFREYRQVGVNRLSLGVQSFNSRLLARIGRIHDGPRAHRAVEAVRAAGFDNFNLDLMFGLPGQSVKESLADVEQAVACSPTHVSFYQLTLEPNTAFHHAPPPLPDDDAQWRMQQQGRALLAEHGYRQYEVSAHALDGRQCRHNRNYWEFGDYLGIGAGAHGKLTDMARQAVQRRVRRRHPGQYLASPSDRVSSVRDLAPDELVFEFMLNAFRLSDGFAPELFEARTGLAWAVVDKAIGDLRDRGLIEPAGKQSAVVPTDLGKRFINEIVSVFLEGGETGVSTDFESRRANGNE